MPPDGCMRRYVTASERQKATVWDGLPEGQE